VSFTVCYSYGIQPWRSASYAIGVLSMLVLGWMGTGIFIYFQSKLPPSPPKDLLTGPVALGVMIMLDLLRTWIVAGSTAVNRGKAGLVLVEEDRKLPGISPSTEDVNAAALSQIFAKIQTKDCQIQLALYFVVHLIGTAITDHDQLSGYIAVLALFFISRLAYTIVAVLRLKPVVLTSTALFSVTMVVVLLFWAIVRVF